MGAGLVEIVDGTGAADAKGVIGVLGVREDEISGLVLASGDGLQLLVE